MSLNGERAQASKHVVRYNYDLFCPLWTSIPQAVAASIFHPVDFWMLVFDLKRTLVVLTHSSVSVSEQNDHSRAGVAKLDTR